MQQSDRFCAGCGHEPKKQCSQCHGTGTCHELLNMTEPQKLIMSFFTANIFLFFLEDKQKCRRCSGTGLADSA
jgi:hypothetical protein